MMKCSQPSLAVSPHLLAEKSSSASTSVNTLHGTPDCSGGVDRVLAPLESGCGVVVESIMSQPTSPIGTVSPYLVLEGALSASIPQTVLNPWRTVTAQLGECLSVQALSKRYLFCFTDNLIFFAQQAYLRLKTLQILICVE